MLSIGLDALTALHRELTVYTNNTVHTTTKYLLYSILDRTLMGHTIIIIN